MRRYFTDINHLLFRLQARINISPWRHRRDASEAAQLCLHIGNSFAASLLEMTHQKMRDRRVSSKDAQHLQTEQAARSNELGHTDR